MKSYHGRDEVPMVESCGPVQTVEGECCVGATRATNSTAEMQALIDALLWLSSCEEQKGLPLSSKVMITVDSQYVKGLIDGKFVTRENRVLAILLCHSWKVMKKKLQLHIRWVRGHTGDVEKSTADELADLGTRVEAQHQWWMRDQPMGDWEEDVFIAKILSLQKEKTPCDQARRIQWAGVVDFPRIDPTLQELIPPLGAVTRGIEHLAVKWGSAKNKNSHLDPHDDTMIEMRRLCLERRREKDAVKRKTLSIALHRVRRKMRRNQATPRCNETTQLGAPSRLQGPPPQTRAPVVERVNESGRKENVEYLIGRSDIVHDHFKELFTDPSHAETSEWIEQRWLRENLHSLPTIDGERVKETAFAFRKRTSCAEDMVVIEMLREFDSDIWETIAGCFQVQADESLDRGNRQAVENTANHNGQEKEWQAHDARFSPDCHAADHVPSLLEDVAATGRTSSAVKTWSAVWSRPWSAGTRSGVDARTGGGTGYRVADSGRRDGLRCGSCV